MTGTVNSRLEATIRLVVLSPDGQQQEVTAVIDTGYNGALSLPMVVIGALSLPALAPRQVRLGDASVKLLDFYNADVLWNGQMQRIRVLCVEGDPLIGTALLKGYHLDADFVDGGVVTIEKIP